MFTHSEHQHFWHLMRGCAPASCVWRMECCPRCACCLITRRCKLGDVTARSLRSVKPRPIACDPSVITLLMSLSVFVSPYCLGQHAVSGPRFGLRNHLHGMRSLQSFEPCMSAHAETVRSPVEQFHVAIQAVNDRAKPRTRSTSATPVPIHPVGRPQKFEFECSYYAHGTHTSTLL